MIIFKNNKLMFGLLIRLIFFNRLHKNINVLVIYIQRQNMNNEKRWELKLQYSSRNYTCFSIVKT